MIAIGFVAGCARDPEPAECPTVEPGALVVTEVRGPQKPEDQNGPWIELFNASTSSIDLEGTKVRFRRKDGSTEVPILVRRSVVVGPGEYVVLGLFDDSALPAFADYGFGNDFRDTWLAAAAIDVETCGDRVDVATYDALPDTGTFSFGSAPDANQNDDLSQWCTDPSSLGSPRAANIACP
ncbi:MAG: Por secretion system C-terminal sorting protein [Deltaproteobacteria bacterium]|nr:Por secretion system C-terminal sorting protein [Deltaproteobacteria bacterium]